jgi:hypothetical protein
MLGLFIEKYVGNYVGGSGRGPLERFSNNWQELLGELAKNRHQFTGPDSNLAPPHYS